MEALVGVFSGNRAMAERCRSVLDGVLPMYLGYLQRKRKISAAQRGRQAPDRAPKRISGTSYLSGSMAIAPGMMYPCGSPTNPSNIGTQRCPLTVHANPNRASIMTVYSEPTAIDSNGCNPSEQEEDLQYIHSRLVKSQLGLFRLLANKYGENKFEIEVNPDSFRRPSRFLD
jgi:hypothetical protein